MKSRYPPEQFGGYFLLFTNLLSGKVKNAYTKYLEKLCPNVHIIEGSVGTTLHTKDLLEQKGLLNTSCEEGQITWMNTMDSKIELSKCLFKKLEVEL